MIIVYYLDVESDVCPVKNYFLTKIQNSNIKDKRKEKLFADIDNKIQFAKRLKGRPRPPILKTIHEYSIIEIVNPKDETTVIRILYARHQDKIVLLHAFEKPAKYDTQKEKKKVDKEYKIADEYLIIFKLNPNNYENYE